MTLYILLQILWMFLVPLAAVILPVFLGQQYGLRHSRKVSDFPHESIASVVAAAFGLLAFMLAFTFQIVANRYDTRKALLLHDVTMIRTTYLRAGLLPEPFNSNTKKQLVEYVDLRVQVAKDKSKLQYGLIRSQVILDSLWQYTEALARIDRSSEVYALYTTSVNDIVDTYNQRIAMGLVYRIPAAVLFVLFVLLLLSMFALGYQFGITGKKHFKMNLLLATIFAVVMCLIFALDHPESGLIPLNQKPLKDLQQQLQQKQLDVHTTKL